MPVLPRWGSYTRGGSMVRASQRGARRRPGTSSAHSSRSPAMPSRPPSRRTGSGWRTGSASATARSIARTRGGARHGRSRQATDLPASTTSGGSGGPRPRATLCLWHLSDPILGRVHRALARRGARLPRLLQKHTHGGRYRAHHTTGSARRFGRLAALGEPGKRRRVRQSQDHARCPRPDLHGAAVRGPPAGYVLRAAEVVDFLRVGPRDGRVTDSVIFWAPDMPLFAQSTPDGRSIRMLFPRRGTTRGCNLVRYRVSSSGRITARPDTLARQLNMSFGGDVQDASMVFDYGPTEYSVWALRRDGLVSMQFSQRRLALATAMMYASLTRDGSKVLLVRGSPAGDSRCRSPSCRSTAGRRSRWASPSNLVDWDWSQDGRSVVVGTRRGPDTIAVSRVDVASARSTPITQVASRDYLSFETVPGGGLAAPANARELPPASACPACPTAPFPFPPGVARSVDPSQTAGPLSKSGWDANYDSLLVHRVSIVDGSATRLAAFGGEGVSPAGLAR